MFEVTRGNLLEADVEAVVNTVNTEGVMGKGIALQFRKAYPDNYDAYRRACDTGEVRPGRMFIFERNALTNPRYVINFPTKRRWKSKSRMEDIEAGLDALVEDVGRLGIRSVAVPPPGLWARRSSLAEGAGAHARGLRAIARSSLARLRAGWRSGSGSHAQ